MSALSLSHDEKGYFSAGWDGEAIVRSILAFFGAFLSSIDSNGISTQVNA